MAQAPQDKKKWPKWKNSSKLQKKIQLRDKEIANLSDTEFKTLVIRMLQELSGYFTNKKDLGSNEGRIMWNYVKKNPQGTNSDEKETRTQINCVDQKEEINIQPEQNEETRIQKNEKRLKNLWDNFKRSNIQIIGLPEGEEEDQEIENLSEKIMKENFPNLAKEIDSRKSRKLKESQRSWTQGSAHECAS